MVDLGNHPEVTFACRAPTSSIRRYWEVEDEGKGGPVAFARDRFPNLRAEVMRRRLHEKRFLGNTLRWLGKYLP
jgi:hypothetical protein